MDRGLISTHSPQEDEFALLLLGAPSVYRGFIDPRRLRECGQELWHAGQPDLSRWQDFLRGGLRSAPNRPLLLKSPSHSFRVPSLRALFPRARFVWIGRHSGEMLASNQRMWQRMARRYSLWDFPPAVLEGFLGFETTVAALDRALARIPIHDGSRAAPPSDPRAHRLDPLMAAARRKFGTRQPSVGLGHHIDA